MINQIIYLSSQSSETIYLPAVITLIACRYFQEKRRTVIDQTVCFTAVGLANALFLLLLGHIACLHYRDIFF